MKIIFGALLLGLLGMVVYQQSQIIDLEKTSLIYAKKFEDWDKFEEEMSNWSDSIDQKIDAENEDIDIKSPLGTMRMDGDKINIDSPFGKIKADGDKIEINSPYGNMKVDGDKVNIDF